MLNLTGMVRAPAYHWEVHMDRKRSGSAVQNARRRVAYVVAPEAAGRPEEAVDPVR